AIKESSRVSAGFRNGCESRCHSYRTSSGVSSFRPSSTSNPLTSAASLKRFLSALSPARVQALRTAKCLSSFSMPCPLDTGDTETQDTQGDSGRLRDLGEPRGLGSSGYSRDLGHCAGKSAISK